MRLDATTPRPPTAAEPEQEELLNRAIHPSAKYEGPSTLGGCVLGVGFLLVLVVCAFLNVAFVELPLRFLHHLRLLGDKPWRAIERVVEGWFFAMFAGLIEMVAGVQINMTADPAEDPAMAFPEHARVLLISNHRTEVDWLFFWNLGLRFGCHDRVRVMMKAVIRHAPGVGWAMLLLNFPYVKRDWATDQARITKLMTAYSQFSAGVWLAMFPEGTALYDKSLAQSQEFAQGRDEPRWNYVLVPRVKGFELCVQELDPDFIVDLTVAYPELAQGVRPSPIRIARGQFPAQVDMHVQRFHRSEFAGHKGAMGQWLKDRFADKEELLQSYYENDACFVDKKPICEQASVALPVCIGVAFNAFMLTLAGFWLLVLPLTTCSYLACCTAFCVLKTRRFGAGDAKH